MSEESVVVETGAVARVRLNRPEVHNAFEEELIGALRSAFETLAADDAVRIVVLESRGRSFSAGADLNWMRRAIEFSEEANRKDAAGLAAMLRAVAECPKPVIGRIQGNAYGGGVGLVATTDIAVAVESAQFAFTEVRLGLVPATIAPHVVPKIGRARANALFVLGERFDAQAALEAGLVHRVVAEEDLDAAVDEVVAALLQGGAFAQRRAKELVRAAAAGASDEVDDYTSRLIAELRTGEEGQEGVRAFLEKRSPSWRPETD